MLVVRGSTPSAIAALQDCSYQWYRTSSKSSSSATPSSEQELIGCVTSGYRVNLSDVGRCVSCVVKDGASLTEIKVALPIVANAVSEEGMKASNDVRDKIESPTGFSVHSVKGRANLAARVFRLCFILQKLEPVLFVYEMLTDEENEKAQRWGRSSEGSPSTQVSLDLNQVSEAIDVLDKHKREVIVCGGGLKVSFHMCIVPCTCMFTANTCSRLPPPETLITNKNLIIRRSE